jgi:hypothetical protein
VYVDVTIKEVSPLKFSVLPSPKNLPDQLPTKITGNSDLPIIIFENKKNLNQGFEIHFELQGDTHGYFFPPTSDKENSVWSQCGSDCPKKSAVFEVFQPIRIDDPSSGPLQERRVLVVKNANPDTGNGKGQGPFQYNLRVTNGKDWLDLDPGGDNTNGSAKISINYFSVATVGIITGVLSALVTTFALAKFNLVCPAPPGF